MQLEWQSIIYYVWWSRCMQRWLKTVCGLIWSDNNLWTDAIVVEHMKDRPTDHIAQDTARWLLHFYPNHYTLDGHSL